MALWLKFRATYTPVLDDLIMPELLVHRLHKRAGQQRQHFFFRIDIRVAITLVLKQTDISKVNTGILFPYVGFSRYHNLPEWPFLGAWGTPVPLEEKGLGPGLPNSPYRSTELSSPCPTPIPDHPSARDPTGFLGP